MMRLRSLPRALTLTHMFRVTAKRDLIRGDPTFGDKMEDAGGCDNERQRALSEVEFRQFALCVPNTNLNPRTAAALRLLLATVARAGEFANVR